MSEARIEIFDHNHEPSEVQLEAVCDLFRRALPVFDEEGGAEKAKVIALRQTPNDYRALLQSKTLLLAYDTRQQVAGLLEWHLQEQENVMVVYITWLLVDPSARRQGIATQLHQEFERTCVPAVLQAAQKTVYQSLTVHLKNEGALQMYRDWGYAKDGVPQWNDGRRLCLGKECLLHPREIG